MIRFACPRCKSVLEAPDRKAGSKVACPKCQQRLQIPIPPPPVNKTVLAPFLGHGPDSAIPQPNSPPGKANPDWHSTPPPVVSSRDVAPRVDVESVKAPILGQHTPSPSHGPTPSPYAESDSLELNGLRTDAELVGKGLNQNEARKLFSGGVARCTLACAGALLLLIGQFCPMLRAPENVSVSFFDYSMKAAWLLSKAAVEAMDSAATDSGAQQRSRDSVRFERHEPPSKPSDGPRIVALSIGLVLTLISPFCPLILVVIAVLVLRSVLRELGQTATGGMRAKILTIAGIFCLAALGVLYLGPMLVLWAIPGVLSGVAFGLISFGFGWGVLLFGSFLLLMGGAIR